jgi:hypothetical protein
MLKIILACPVKPAFTQANYLLEMPSGVKSEV